MRHCYVVRVFTIGSSGGNPLGVIPDSTGLEADAMQAIASELGFSETVFIEWTGARPGLRIFTPAVELPFAGHPLVGTAWVLNSPGPGAAVMTIQIGDVSTRMEGDTVWVALPPATHSVTPESGDVPVDVPVTGAWRVTVPSDFLLIGVEFEAELNSADPDLSAVAEAADGLYLFCESDPVRSRFFAPRIGVDEDAATGSAAAAYASLMRSDGLESGARRIWQGAPDALSEILLTWNDDLIELGGTVVLDEVRVLD